MKIVRFAQRVMDKLKWIMTRLGATTMGGLWIVIVLELWIPATQAAIGGMVLESAVMPQSRSGVNIKEEFPYRAPESPSTTPSNAVPTFDPASPVNYTVQLGSHAYLPCRIRHVGNKSVSWVRKADGHLLAVDRDTFIADGRFQALHLPASDTWTLNIKNVKAADGGQYECQVSSEPKTSLVITLNVIVPLVEIRGSPDIYVMSGSAVTIQCVITGMIEEPPFVFWYQNGARVAGLEVVRTTDVQLKPSVLVSSSSTSSAHKTSRVTRLGKDALLAVLALSSASGDMSGNYTCQPSSLGSASATLHVLNGEQPAAMQHGKNGSPPTTTPLSGAWLLVLSLILANNVWNADWIRILSTRGTCLSRRLRSSPQALDTS